MIQHDLYRAVGNQRLLLFFAGWGMDNHLLDAPYEGDTDYCICYDYTDLSFDYSRLAHYTHIELYAWSMGVWVAAHTLQGRGLPIVDSCAINGTHYPIDEERGIAPAIFEATLAGVSEGGMKRFNRRMCGSMLPHFTAHAPQRTIESLHTELAAIQQAVTSHPAPTMQWERVIIGENDRIFLPENQRNAWQDSPYTVVDEAHYLDFNALIQEHEDR